MHAAGLVVQMKTANMKDSRPRCTKCGEPARVVIVRDAYVQCELGNDGSVGRVLYALIKDSKVKSYKCGGGHTWKMEVK